MDPRGNTSEKKVRSGGSWGYKFGATLRNNIIIGLFLVTPVLLTIYIVNWVFTYVTNQLLPICDRVLPASWQAADHELLLRILSLLAVLALLFMIGVFARNILGRRLYQLGDGILTRIPGINKLYVSIRQISESVVAQKQTMFQEVALVEYPRKGVYSMGFVTATAPDDILAAGVREQESDEWVSLFVPTTPNPTSGVLIFAPRKDLLPLKLNVADAMKLLISGGVAVPGVDSKNPASVALLDKLESWMVRKHQSTNSELIQETPDADA